MKQIYLESYGGPEVLKLREAPIPDPKEGEVLLRMKATGVSKPDYLMRTGVYPWTKDILPFYPGLYGAGVIEALGPGVSGFEKGQLVYVDHPVVCGCYSEYKTAPVGHICALPAGIDPASAAVSTNYLIAWSMIADAMQPSQGKTLYIKGAAGALGTAIVLTAPLHGMRVIASASSDAKCAYLRELGADTVFCYKTADEHEAIMAATDGKGVDYLMDQCVGEDFPTRLDLLARCGTVFVYNTLNGDPKENLVSLLTSRYPRCPAVRAFSFHLHDGYQDELDALRKTVFEQMAAGKIKPRIGASFHRDEIVKAHELLDSGSCLGSIILVD